MPPKCPCLRYVTSISFSITLSSSYLCRSPTMAAVLSSVEGLLDGGSLNGSDMGLLTRVTTKDFYLPLWKSGLCVFWLQGSLLFLIKDLSGWIRLPSVRQSANTLEAQPSWLRNREKGYDGYDGLSHAAGRGPEGLLCQPFSASALALSPTGPLSGWSGSSIDLVGAAFSLAQDPQLTVIVGHCLPFLTEPGELIRSFAESVGRG